MVTHRVTWLRGSAIKLTGQAVQLQAMQLADAALVQEQHCQPGKAAAAQPVCCGSFDDRRARRRQRRKAAGLAQGIAAHAEVRQPRQGGQRGDLALKRHPFELSA